MFDTWFGRLGCLTFLLLIALISILHETGVVDKGSPLDWIIQGVFWVAVIFFMILARKPDKPYTTYTKKGCSACGRIVSSTAKPGQNCPYCGAYWSDERDVTFS